MTSLQHDSHIIVKLVTQLLRAPRARVPVKKMEIT